MRATRTTFPNASSPAYQCHENHALARINQSNQPSHQSISKRNEPACARFYSIVCVCVWLAHYASPDMSINNQSNTHRTTHTHITTKHVHIRALDIFPHKCKQCCGTNKGKTGVYTVVHCLLISLVRACNAPQNVPRYPETECNEVIVCANARGENAHTHTHIDGLNGIQHVIMC